MFSLHFSTSPLFRYMLPNNVSSKPWHPCARQNKYRRSSEFLWCQSITQASAWQKYRHHTKDTKYSQHYIQSNI